MKIQVFGHRGMLGGAVCRAVQERGHELIAVDGLRISSVTAMDVVKRATVINCAGLVKQRKATPREFMQTNGYGPYHLANACDENQTRLIHVSTDCVFTHGPSLETNTPPIPDNTDMYVRSKLAGEVVYGQHLTVRTSFVGFGYSGLIHDLLTQSTIRASKNLWWSGHTVDTVANILVVLAERPEITGLLHIPGEAQSRFTLVSRLIDWLGVDTRIIEDNAFIVDRRLISIPWHYHGLPLPPKFVNQLVSMHRPEVYTRAL